MKVLLFASACLMAVGEALSLNSGLHQEEPTDLIADDALILAQTMQ